MGFLGKIGLNVAGGAIAKWAIGGGVVLLIAAFVGFGAYMSMKGSLMTNAQWLGDMLDWHEKQEAVNKQFDQVTTKKNTDFIGRIQEIDAKWNVKPQQQ